MRPNETPRDSVLENEAELLCINQAFAEMISVYELSPELFEPFPETLKSIIEIIERANQEEPVTGKTEILFNEVQTWMSVASLEFASASSSDPLLLESAKSIFQRAGS